MSALLALSDGLVVRALERAYSRGLPGGARRYASQQMPRHRAYELVRIPDARHSHALEDAFTLTVDYVHRWQLPVEPEAWAAVLDDYCRGLLRSQRAHTLDDLELALRLLGAGHAA